MRPIAIDVTLSVVCVSVCLSVTGAVYFSCMYSRCDMSTWIFIRIYGYDLDEPYNTGWTDRDAVWATESRGTKKPCIRWGSRLSYGKRNFWELSGPLKSVWSLCCGVRCKRNHSIVSDCMKRKILFNTQYRHDVRCGRSSKFFDHLLLLLLLLLLLWQPRASCWGYD